MTDEEFAELTQLSSAKQKLREDRMALIAGLRETLQSQGITLQELYSVTEITTAGLLSGAPLGQRALNAEATTPASVPGVKKPWVRQQTGLVLIEIRQDHRLGGFPCRYCRGQPLRYYLPEGLKLLDDGRLEANLESCYTVAGRQYFGSETGWEELARLLNFIRPHDVKPHLR